MHQRMQVGNGCKAPPLRRCGLIPCPAPRMAHNSTAVPRDFHLRDEDSQAQRSQVSWTLKPVLKFTTADSHCGTHCAFPHSSDSSLTRPSLSGPSCPSVSSLVSLSSASQWPSAFCSLCLAKLMGESWGGLPRLPPPLPRSWPTFSQPVVVCFIYLFIYFLIHQIYLGSIPGAP